MSPTGRSASRAKPAGVVAGLLLAASSAGLTATLGRHPTPAPAPVAPVNASAAPGPSAPGPAALPRALTLPDPQLHPGATNTALTQAQLCAAGFSTSTIRPPVSYTDQLKRLELGTGGSIRAPSGKVYAVVGEQLPGTVADYELDHLISLELGGNPEDPANLWMQPWERKADHLAAPGQGAESKDVVENRLHREVCAGTIALADAQHEIATDWTSAG